MFRPVRIIWALALALVAGCVWWFVWYWDVIPPDAMTITAIGETFVRINLYAETNRSIPLSLDVLPKREGYANRTTDGWGRPLVYKVAADGVITLTSFGADGQPGGEGPDADLSQSYRCRRPEGSLWVGSPMWIVEAEIHPQGGAANGSQPVRSETNGTSRAAGSRR
jgi:hypothetical protein